VVLRLAFPLLPLLVEPHGLEGCTRNSGKRSQLQLDEGREDVCSTYQRLLRRARGRTWPRALLEERNELRRGQ
jgi:hypothetical protein